MTSKALAHRAVSTAASALITCAALLFSAHPAHAQVENNPTPGPNPKVPWLHEGLVFTASWYAQSHSGHSMDFKEDENGNWQAPDGTPLAGSEHPSTSAGGISQAVVTCMGGDKVVLEMQSFTDMRMLGFPDPIPQGKPKTFYVAIAQCDLWMEPDILQSLTSDPSANRVVQPIKWISGNQQIDAIRVTIVKPDHYITHVYDRSTGLCLHAAEASQGSTPELKYTIPGETPAGDSQLSSYNFISTRTKNTPWATEQMPAWTSTFKTLHYVGQSQVAGGFMPSTPTQLGLDVTRYQSGDGWLGMTTSGFLIAQGEQKYPQQGYYLAGRDEFDTFFAGPNSLANLQQGQVLDSDPVTHVQTVVSAADGNSVTITESNASASVYHTFDRASGKVIAFGKTDTQTKIQTSFQLQSEE